jgi:cellulose synthase/poly-beta-1,6-N-acetylglucosamine synthase-like glycosyltransferase
MRVLEYFIIILYTTAAAVVLLYAIAQLNLLLNYLATKKSKQRFVKIDLDALKAGYPYVTIQLPVYNELYVMKGLLENIGKLDYPKDRLEIQVLDDSTDESYELTKGYVSLLKDQGFDIHHIHRINRVGFKAGALKQGLEAAKGEYIAIFDADFLPKKDWLLHTIPYFSNEKIGVIQTRWTHVNRNYSLLTKVQAFALDAHFTIEQVGRNSKKHFMNFNGTAGVWRKACIIDAGNWEGDTLTEDLDLSYRAQLKNWEFIFLEDVETLAELPVVLSAAKSQQFRWNKGAAENFRKTFKRLVQSKNIKTKTKLHGMLHLLNSSMFLGVFTIALLSVPMLYIKNEHLSLSGYFVAMSFFTVTTFIFFIYYWVMYKTIYGKGFKNFLNFIGMFLAFFCIAMGFSLHNSLAVLEGHWGKKSDFIRTPKFNLSAGKNRLKENKYLSKKLSLGVIAEGILMLYFLFGMYSAFVVGEQGGDFGFFPFHLMLAVGFGYVFFQSVTTKIS